MMEEPPVPDAASPAAARSKGREPLAKVGDRPFQIREDVMAEEIARSPQIPVGRIRRKGEILNSGSFEKILPGHGKKRTQNPAVTGTNRFEALETAAELHAEKHRLRLIVPVMGRDDIAGSESDAKGLEGAVANAARGSFETFFGGRSVRRVEEMERDAQGVTKSLGRRRPSSRVGIQAVIDMSRLDLKFVNLGKLSQAGQEGCRVRAAGKRHQYELAGSYGSGGGEEFGEGSPENRHVGTIKGVSTGPRGTGKHEAGGGEGT